MLKFLEDFTGLDRNYYVFLFVFFAILIVPFNLYFYLKDYFYQYYSPQHSELYAILCCVGFIWSLIWVYIIYYFAEDFQVVFCNKGKQVEIENEANSTKKQEKNKAKRE